MTVPTETKRSWGSKSPAEVVDRGIDWSRRLKTRTIVTQEWVAPVELTLTGQTLVGSVTSIRIAGGVDGQNYALQNRVVLNTGETLEAVIYQPVVAK